MSRFATTGFSLAAAFLIATSLLNAWAILEERESFPSGEAVARVEAGLFSVSCTASLGGQVDAREASWQADRPCGIDDEQGLFMVRVGGPMVAAGGVGGVWSGLAATLRRKRLLRRLPAGSAALTVSGLGLMASGLERIFSGTDSVWDRGLFAALAAGVLLVTAIVTSAMDESGRRRP